MTTEILLKAMLEQCVEMGLLTVNHGIYSDDPEYNRTILGMAVQAILERFND